MKRVIITLAVLLSLGTFAKAQSRTYLQAGVAVGGSTTFESLELGATSGKNRVGIVAETYTPGNDLTINSARQTLLGIKYGRILNAGDRWGFVLSAAAKVHADTAHNLSVEPGIGATYNITPGFGLTADMTSPINEETTPLKPVHLKAGVGLKFTF